MKKIILFFIIFTLIFCSLALAQEITLTLDEAINIALRDNRDVLLKAEDVNKAKEKIAESQGALLPTLNFTGSWTDTQGYYSKDLAQTTTQTTFKQYLYKGGKTLNTIAQDKYKSEVSAALLEKTKIEVILNVKKAFYTLLLAHEFVNLNQGIVENTRQHLNLTEERYQNGQASESDILNIEASLSTVQQAYEASLNQAEAARVLLNNLLYLDQNTRIRPDAQFGYEAREIAYDEAFLKAMQNRPEIIQYVAQTKADKKAIEIAKADNRPSIYAAWDYYSRSHTSATTNRSWNDYNIIGLTFSWPIFDGWATKAKVEQAIVDLKETQLLKEKTVNDIALELKNAYLSLWDAITKIQATESQIKLYADNLTSINQKYADGLASSLDQSDAGLKYEISLFNKKQAIYDYIIAKGSFDKATGGI
jgi:outer membrane protein TolC